MIIQMDKTSTPTPRERAQQLYNKNIDLENKRRQSAQARVPSDPNAWHQMRENYEAIILDDHTFSEQHNIEYELWQLHYKRIEEFRSHFSAAQSSGRSSVSNGGKGPPQSDRVMKIRVQFKTFLSEATGFYHDLILKIRAKCGLPLLHFAEDSDNHIGPGTDATKSSEVKKGLVSCHRCLIYLGDLARYKGLYGEGESRIRDYAAASSYYLQAASLWPSSGNPHHQLAILASYSSDELVAVYRYFRSLAAEIPFPTAKDNLIVAFEKNRQNYNHLLGNVKASLVKESGGHINSKVGGNNKVRVQSGNTASDASLVRERSSGMKEKYKEFCVAFVRLNGILFTHTSLEAFTELLSSVSSALRQLLSSGAEEEQNFGVDATDNRLAILRITSILIFTVSNVNRKTEGQTYAEILQHTVLLQNACTAAFELMSIIVERCLQLPDPSSSFLFPGILVFLEWLACCPDVATSTNVEGTLAASKQVFWKLCIALFNKILADRLVLADEDGDEACFTSMARYDEGDTEARLALWEDFELRGFLPLVPSQSILDFSRKHSVGVGGSNKEKRSRIRRTIAAGKALSRVAAVEQNAVYFDSKVKQFVIGVQSQMSVDGVPSSHLGTPEVRVIELEIPKVKVNSGIKMNKEQLLFEGEDEDEEIVFKPASNEKQADIIGFKGSQDLMPGQSAAQGIDVHFRQSASSQHHQMIDLHNSRWATEQQSYLVNGFRGMSITEIEPIRKPETKGLSGISEVGSLLPPIQSTLNNPINSGVYPGQRQALEMMAPKVDPVLFSEISANLDTLAAKAVPFVSAASRSQTTRPVRHVGPPPGFSHVASKPVSLPPSSLDGTGGFISVDDYSWLDGYKMPSSSSSIGPKHTINHSSIDDTQFIGNGGNLVGTTGFPFPGKQVSAVQFQGGNLKGYEGYQPFGTLNIHQHMVPEQQHLGTGQQYTSLPQNLQGQSTWTGQYRV